MEWRENNHVEFNNSNDKIIAFTQCKKPVPMRKLSDARITVRGHSLGFNKEATRWLGVYLNTVLQSTAHKILSLENARKTEERERRLESTLYAIGEALGITLHRRGTGPPWTKVHV